MTIKDLFNANRDMSYHDIYVLHCRFSDSSRGNSTDGIINGCIIYQDEYNTMPEVLKGLKVKSFKCLRHTRSVDEFSKWEIWVV